MVNTYIAASKIEGVGVFASEPIKAGTVIWRPNPSFDLLVSDADYRSSPPHLQQLLDRYAYASQDRPGFLVYEADNGRFMNHAEVPNTDFSVYGSGWAVSDIAAGDEITCDYGQFYNGFDESLHASS